MSAPSNPLPVDYEEMEFEIIDESWNRYELDKGVTIKGRVILGKLMRDPNDPKKVSFDITPPKWAVYSPVHLRGNPTTELLNDQSKQKDFPKHKVKININHEPWNVYRILRTGQELKIKLTIDDIFRFTDAYDQNGSPFYNIPNGIAIAIKENKPEQGQ